MKAKSKYYAWTLLAASVLSYSCDDIIEKDISDKNIQALSPLSNAEISSNAVTFQWNEIDGAENYRLQIFSSQQIISVDTLVSHSGFSVPLSPGSYQWRVRGENFAYETAYTFPLSFSVLLTTDLTNQQVFLTNPADGIYTNDAGLSFAWEELAAATSYDFQLVNQTNGNSIVYTQNDITSNGLTIPVSAINDVNASFAWKVRAKNDSSHSAFFSRTFNFDSTPPNQVQLSAPLNNATALSNTTIVFGWTAPQDTGVIQSPIVYIVEFATDSTFSSIVQTSTASANSLSQIFTSTGVYYWRVKAVDTAGNTGALSGTFSFTIN